MRRWMYSRRASVVRRLLCRFKGDASLAISRCQRWKNTSAPYSSVLQFGQSLQEVQHLSIELACQTRAGH